jgi:hypothetical protein
MSDDVTPEEKAAAKELRSEVASLLHALNQAHQTWQLTRLTSKTARVTSYIACRALMNAFTMDGMPDALRDAAVRFADEIRLETRVAADAFANSGKIGKA